MKSSSGKFNWKSLRNLLLSLVFSIVTLPLLLLLFLSLGYKEPTQATTNLKKQKVSTQPNTSQTPDPPAKIVLIDPNPAKPALTSSSEDADDEETNAAPPPASNPPSTPPSSPPAQQPNELEFTGTVTGISNNIVTFSYGNNQSVAITLTKSSSSEFQIGTRAQVHAKLKNGIYLEDEIEIK